MRRLLRALRPALETLIAGLLLGLVIAVIGAQLLGSSQPPPRNGELPAARAYMLAIIRGDADAMNAVGADMDPATQTLIFQALSGPTIHSLTYLGGSGVSNGAVHEYVIEADGANGPQLVPLALTVISGRIVHITSAVGSSASP